jgi:hypothetical protein
MAIGADLIAGFPTEDAAMHADNLSIVAAAGIVHGHVFPYSPRPGTPAARMPQVPPALVRERARNCARPWRKPAPTGCTAWSAALHKCLPNATAPAMARISRPIACLPAPCRAA